MAHIDKNIVRFLNEEMNAAEAASFRLKIARNPALQKQLEDYVLMHKTTEKIAVERIENKLQGRIGQARKKTGQVRKLWWLAGGAVLLLTILFFARPLEESNAPLSPPPEQVIDTTLIPVAYLNYRQLSENILAPFQSMSDTDSSLMVILNTLKQEDYPSAVSQLAEIPVEHPNYTRLLLARVFCHLKTKQYIAARELLDLVDWQQQAAHLREEAEWLSALQFLLVGDANEANDRFKNIAADDKHAHYADAKKILY